MIESKFDKFSVVGENMLAVRVHEFNATKRCKASSRVNRSGELAVEMDTSVRRAGLTVQTGLRP